MSVSINMMNVKEIVSQEKYKLDSGTYIKDIIITTSDGSKYTITLFADNSANLQIREKGSYTE